MTDREQRLVIPDLPDESEYPSELINKYALIECYGDKENTRTFLVQDMESGGKFVAKCYLRESALYDREEPEVLRGLDVDPLPHFVAEYRNEQMRCVLWEYVPGETLSELAKQRSFTEEDVLETGLELCDQLEKLHSLQPPVIHRDIKPQNVVKRPDGRLVLIDFEIARARSDNETDTLAFGTQGFASPEQYGYAQTDARSDIYSLGILLNWLLHRETKITKTDTALEKVIARCAAFDPEKRYADAGEVRKALLAARPEEQKRRHLFMTIAAALAVLLAAVGIFTTAGSQRKTVEFSEPLIEQAVRLNLGLEEGKPVTEDMLGQVTAVYIVKDKAYATSDEFYPAISAWYAEGDRVHGTLKTLDDLAGMTELEQVCVVAEELESLSALENFEKINKVECKHNYITDISALAGMDRLTSVGINDNPVQDITPLTECPNLAFLDLCSVRTYDPSVMSRLGNFDYLDISNPTLSYEYLAGKRILSLCISWTSLSDLHVLDEVTGLERLEIGHTDVTDLSPLAKHTGLKKLVLPETPVKDLQVLKELPQLEEVTISEDMKPMADALGDVPFEVIIE